MAIIPEDQNRPALSAATGSPPREPVSAVLRQAREAAGYDVNDVAQLLRIQRQYLQAIEDARYADLPGTVYAIGFVRTYADFLGLDTTEMVRRFKDDATELEAHADYNFPEPPPEARVPGAALLTIGLLLAGVAYGGWYVYGGDEEGLIDRVSEIPDRFSELASRGGEQTPRPDTDTAPPTPSPDAPVTIATSTGPAPPADVPDVADAPPNFDALAAWADTQIPAADEGPATADAPEAVAPEAVAEEPLVAETLAPAPVPSRIIEPVETVRTVEPTQRVPPAVPPQPASGQIEVATATPPPDPLNPTGLPKAATATSTGPVPRPEPRNAPLVIAGPGMTAPVPVEAPQDRTAVAEAPPPPPPALDGDQSRRGGFGNLNSRILIRAVEMSWVQITDDLGNLLMTRVLEPGESYRVPNSDGLTLASGNAGGLEVLVDGVVQPPLGLRGTVVRNVSLDPESFGVRNTN